MAGKKKRKKPGKKPDTIKIPLSFDEMIGGLVKVKPPAKKKNNDKENKK